MRARFPVRLFALMAGGLLLGGLAGCATPPPANDPEAVADFRQTNDPLEPTNRVLYKVNDALDTAILVPVAKTYRFVVPSPVRTGIHNLLENIGTPVRLTNDVLQGQPLRAGDTAIRFLVNTTLGMGGLFDVGSSMGIPGHETDFGLTLGHWGLSEGPFLYLPLLGPTNPRDGVGYATDVAMDPFTWIGRGTTAYTIGNTSRAVLNVVDKRTNFLDVVEQVKKTALDPYATFRSLYRQNRNSELEKLRASDPPENHRWMPQWNPPKTGP